MNGYGGGGGDGGGDGDGAVLGSESACFGWCGVVVGKERSGRDCAGDRATVMMMSAAVSYHGYSFHSDRRVYCDGGRTEGTRNVLESRVDHLGSGPVGHGHTCLVVRDLCVFFLFCSSPPFCPGLRGCGVRCHGYHPLVMATLFAVSCLYDREQDCCRTQSALYLFSWGILSATYCPCRSGNRSAGHPWQLHIYEIKMCAMERNLGFNSLAWHWNVAQINYRELGEIKLAKSWMSCQYSSFLSDSITLILL